MNNHVSNGVFEVGKNAKKEYRREKEREKKKEKDSCLEYLLELEHEQSREPGRPEKPRVAGLLISRETPRLQSRGMCLELSFRKASTLTF